MPVLSKSAPQAPVGGKDAKKKEVEVTELSESDLIEEGEVVKRDSRAALREWRAVISHLRSLRIAWEGPRGSPWLEQCRDTLDRLMDDAAEVRRVELIRALQPLSEAAQGTPSAADLIAAYTPLVELAPDLFDIARERDVRRARIITGLLWLEGVSWVQAERLEEGGLGSPSALLGATPEVIAQTGRFEVERGVAVHKALETYCARVDDPVASPRPGEELQQLEEQVLGLLEVHEAFEKVAGKWSEEARAERIVLRRARERAFLTAVITLTRLGELEVIAELDRSPFAQRVERLDSYVQTSVFHKLAESAP